MAATALEQTLSHLAGSDLSAKQFFLVKVSTAADDTVLLAAANSDVCLGVLNNKPTSGQPAAVQIAGRAKVTYGGTVTRGDKLMSDASGKAVTRTAPFPVVGVAVESGVSGEIRAIDLLGTAAVTGNLGAATTETYAATVSIDSTKVNHRIAGVNGTSATSTFNASTAGSDGDVLVIEVTSDSGGTCTITFGTNFKPSATLAVTASHYAIVSFRSDGTNWKEVNRSAIITS